MMSVVAMLDGTARELGRVNLNKQQKNFKHKVIHVNNVKLNVKVARTPGEHFLGLMNVGSMPKNSGMLFEYPTEQTLSFWMKNTTIPLSIAFINELGIITQIELLEPLDQTTVKSEQLSKWALEVNRGWFQENNIEIGDKIDLHSKQVNIKIIKQ